MSSSPSTGQLHPLNILLDLPKVANLIELCFQKNMDREGKRYIQQMRAASKDKSYLNWESNSLPLKGYVWKDKKNIVGNISIVPFRKEKEETILLANIAVHPDYRRKGIARQLTQKGLEDARKRGAKSIWLHVEESNFGAIKLYQELGFQPHSRRTRWETTTERKLQKKIPHTHISPRVSQFWGTQKNWLNRVYPPEILWYRMPNWEILKPGLKHWLYKFFVESDIRQWSIQKDGELQGILIWIGSYARRAPIFLAPAPQADSQSLSNLLLHARLHLRSRKQTLYINFPADQFTETFKEAGFIPRHTLLWMRAKF